MNKITSNIKAILKNVFKKDYIKKILHILIIIILIYVILLIIAIWLVDGLIEENKIRQKERRRAYEEGICKYGELCEYP